MKKPGIAAGLFLCFNPPNIVAESGQLAAQMVEGALIDHFTRLRIHFVLDDAAHKFRFIHYHRIKEDQNLPQMILAARTADGAHLAGLNQYRFAGQRLLGQA